MSAILFCWNRYLNYDPRLVVSSNINIQQIVSDTTSINTVSSKNDSKIDSILFSYICYQNLQDNAIKIYIKKVSPGIEYSF